MNVKSRSSMDTLRNRWGESRVKKGGGKLRKVRIKKKRKVWKRERNHWGPFLGGNENLQPFICWYTEGSRRRKYGVSRLKFSLSYEGHKTRLGKSVHRREQRSSVQKDSTNNKNKRGRGKVIRGMLGGNDR